MDFLVSPNKEDIGSLRIPGNIQAFETMFKTMIKHVHSEEK